jgi:DNA polymerase III sliding clamp (beta) subunit (PCNA family)
LQRLKTLTTEDRRMVLLDIRDGRITASCDTPNGQATDSIPVDIKGDPVTIGVRLDHTVEFLSLMEIEVVMAGFGGPKRAMVLGPVDPGVTCVVAPMHLPESKDAAPAGQEAA